MSNLRITTLAAGGWGRWRVSQTVDNRLDRLDKIKVFPGFSYEEKLSNGYQIWLPGL